MGNEPIYSSMVLSVITFVYFLSAVLYIVSWIFKNGRAGRIATWVTVAAAIGNSAGILLRWVESYNYGLGHAPLSNMYESLIFFGLVVTVIYLFVEFKYQSRIIGAFVTPMVFLIMAYAALSPNQGIKPLVPALKSNWLIAHVVTCFLGYAGFAIAFGVSLMYMVKNYLPAIAGKLSGILPQSDILDDLTHRMVMFGFLFLSIGIITGSVWANSAWGSYWSWDPKETWSLITWLIYSFLLHARLMRGWTGSRIAYISIIGFMAVLFTFFGVNYLPGLHSYAK